MELGLDGYSVVVTGATSGIGLAAATLFVAAGAQVVTASRADQGPGVGEVHHVTADLFQSGGPERVIETAERELAGLDVLVNNVGFAAIRLLEGVTDRDWDSALQANFFSSMRATRAALPGMLARGSGVITNVASTAGRRPSVRMPDYSVAKAALLAYSRQVAETYGERGIRCNAIIPGPTLTSSWLAEGGLADQQGEREQVLRAAAAARLLGRFAEPEEIASAIVFLSSPLASHINGVEWSVSGGTVP